MIDLSLRKNGDFVLNVDTSIYDNWVIDKVLYWFSNDYILTRKINDSNHVQEIIMSLKPGHNHQDFDTVKEKLSNDFIDYKNRQTIAKETANIRDLLFAKAFANSDDFVEFTFQD